MPFASPRMLAFAGLLGLISSACFIEPGEPPAFRANCSADADCKDGESCIASLCQLPCSFATFEEDCPQDGNYFACFNGVCASTCDGSGEDNPCPGAQSCIEFDLSGFEDAGGQSFSVCGQMCDEAGAPPCPGEEVCIEGVCVDFSGGGETGTTGGY